MVSTIKGVEMIKFIPLEKLLTETDAPFTYDKLVNNRMDSLNKAIKGIAEAKGKLPEEIKQIIAKILKGF